MRISDWSSDVCSSDLIGVGHLKSSLQQVAPVGRLAQVVLQTLEQGRDVGPGSQGKVLAADGAVAGGVAEAGLLACDRARDIDPHRDVVLLDTHGQFSLFAPAEAARSEEHTSELQSLMRISYAVFCLTKKNL